MILRRLLSAFLLVSVLAPAAALADTSEADKATARELALQGFDALRNKDWSTAADRFTRADALFHAPTITLGLARALQNLGKLVSAQEMFSRVAHETVPANASTAFVDAIENGKRELALLAPRVPGVVINVKSASGSPPDLKVTLDDGVVPGAALGVKRAADPGAHVVRARATGFSPVEATITLAEGKTEIVTLELKPGAEGPPLPTAPPSPGAADAPRPAEDAGDSSTSMRRTLGFVGIGLGAAGVAAGAIAGGLALSKHSDIAAQCPSGVCMPALAPSLQPKIDSYHTISAVSTAGFVAGGALAVTGIILVATAPRAARKASVTPVVGAGYLGAQGRF